jgi:hypothetical protein
MRAKSTKGASIIRYNLVHNSVQAMRHNCIPFSSKSINLFKSLVSLDPHELHFTCLKHECWTLYPPEALCDQPQLARSCKRSTHTPIPTLAGNFLGSQPLPRSLCCAISPPNLLYEASGDMLHTPPQVRQSEVPLGTLPA